MSINFTDQITIEYFSETIKFNVFITGEKNTIYAYVNDGTNIQKFGVIKYNNTTHTFSGKTSFATPISNVYSGAPIASIGEIDKQALIENTKGIEIAIGGGCVLDHPDIEKLIEKLRVNNLPSITINQKDIENSNYTIFETRKELFNKVCGIGVSVYNGYDDHFFDYINSLSKTLKDKIVIHTILGVNTYEEITNIINNNIDKILILGYKMKGRGNSYYVLNHVVLFNIDKFKNTILNLMKNDKLILAFDNLAVNQLNLKQIVNHNVWKKYFMGNDGEFSMYIDFVKNEYSLSSNCKHVYKLDESSNLCEVFKNIRKTKRGDVTCQY